MLTALTALTALLARGPALSLPVLALTRRRLKKSSIYLSFREAGGWREARAVSANSANRRRLELVGTSSAASRPSVAEPPMGAAFADQSGESGK